MFIAMCRCEKIYTGLNSTEITLKFSGAAFGKRINKIVCYYDNTLFDFKFLIKNEYIVYLKFLKIEEQRLYGKVIYFQDFSSLTVN